MAVAWTDITNAQVAAGAAVTTALMTALRDNPEGIAQRASGAPKIFSVPYDFQEFASSGTWTKPSNVETGDKVYVRVVGGGGGGGSVQGVSSNAYGQGGGGAGGILVVFDVDELASTEDIVVGAGGAGGAEPVSSDTGNDGTAGGNSSFAAGKFYEMVCTGGGGGDSNGINSNAATAGEARFGDIPILNDTTNLNSVSSSPEYVDTEAGDFIEFFQGNGGLYAGPGGVSVTHAEGGSLRGFGNNQNFSRGLFNDARGGIGANENSDTSKIDGLGPGAGGGGRSADNGGTTGSAGDGADGIVQVWVVKET